MRCLKDRCDRNQKKRLDAGPALGRRIVIDSTKSKPVEAVRKLLPREVLIPSFDFVGTKLVAKRGLTMLGVGRWTLLGRSVETEVDTSV